MSFKKKFGEKFKYLRKRFGYTQEEIAEKIGMQPNTISFVENGRFYLSLSKVEILSGLYNIEPDEFFKFLNTDTVGENEEKIEQESDRDKHINRLNEILGYYSDKEINTIYRHLEFYLNDKKTKGL